MTTAQRLKLQRIGNLACILWIISVGWLMWATLPRDTVETHGSDTLKDRMSTECNGSYKDRYRCKEDLIIESGQEAFWTLSLRFLLVVIPPLAGSLALSSYLRKHELDELHLRNHHNAQHAAQHGYGQASAHGSHGHSSAPHHDDSWKSRAHRHSSELSPEEAARDLHLREREWEREHQHTAAEHHHHSDHHPAPVPEWKSRAQRHIHQSTTEEEREP